MSHTTNQQSPEGVKKLKDIVDEINICLFCTNLKTDEGSTCRPMGTQDVDSQGNLWFFSDINSDKNREIEENKNVQLFYSHPGKSTYLVVNGEAEIINDQTKIEELWNPIVKIWFKEGKNDPDISIIKVNTKSAYYWDADGNKMINFFKILASVATGTTLISGKEGVITV